MFTSTPTKNPLRTSRREPWRRNTEDHHKLDDISDGIFKNQTEDSFSYSQQTLGSYRPERRYRPRNSVWFITLFVLCITGYYLMATAISGFPFSTLFNPLGHTSSSVINYPRAFLHVDLASRKYKNLEGVSTTAGGRLHINKTLSVILQFNAVNAHVEHCKLGLKLASSLSSGSISLRQEAFTISLFQLDYFETMDEGTLAHSETPTRMITLGDIDIVPGRPIDWKQSFNCAQDAVLAFELACTSGHCSLEWFQNRFQEDPNNCFYMNEYPRQ